MYLCGKLDVQRVLVAMVASLVTERMLVAVVPRYVCGKSVVVQRVLLAVVAKVASLISDYLVIVLGCSGCNGCKFGDRKGLGCSGCKVCMWETSCTKGVGFSGCKGCQLSIAATKVQPLGHVVVAGNR